MGAYGGTAQASMSPNDVGNIADLDLDWFIYRTDLPFLVDEWLSEAAPLKQDMTGDGIVSFPDFAVFAHNWSKPPMPGQGQVPVPSDGAVGVSRTPTLSWLSHPPATWHHVYVGPERPGVYQGTIKEPSFQTALLDPNTVYYWRIDEMNPAGTTQGEVWSFETGASPDRATYPNPPDGTPRVGGHPALSWEPGSGAVSHDVYFGRTNPPPFRTNQEAAMFDPGYLQDGTTFYWRIDEVNSHGTTRGIIWTFTTGWPMPQ
jgi:hypothetical protein